jgi:small subunit ribosomal protein S1
MGKVTNITDFGVFVELEQDIEGLIHISELSKEKVQNPSDVVSVGETVSAMVINVDSKERKIGLSIRGLKERDEKEEVERYMAAQESPTPSLGRLIQEEMAKKARKEEQEKEGELEGSPGEGDEPSPEQGDQGGA